MSRSLFFLLTLGVNSSKIVKHMNRNRNGCEYDEKGLIWALLKRRSLFLIM